MFSRISSCLTPENIKAIYKVGVKMVEVLKNRTDNDWKKKSILSIVIAAVAILLLAIFIIYFIVTHRIAPLMIYTACMTPILAFGLAQYSRNMVSLAKEYDEYRSAIRSFLLKVKEVSGVTADDAVASVAAVLSTIQRSDGTTITDDTTLAQIKELEAYPSACTYAEFMQAIGASLQTLREEGLDVINILDELDVDALSDAETLSEENTIADLNKKDDFEW